MSEGLRKRPLGRTGLDVSEIGFGAWAIGGQWGEVDDARSLRALHRALDCGVTFIDTADVYGDGRSERLVARVRKERTEPLVVATKAGRRLPAQTVEGYSLTNLRSFVERSLQNLDVETIDLLQLHCPPPEIYGSTEAFDALDVLVTEGKVRHYGVSVETVAEAEAALGLPHVKTVQIIFNMFRHKPADSFFAKAAKAGVGIIARVPLASGLLSGKLTRDSVFGAEDHRRYNRHGERFDMGETFSGVPYEEGLRAVEELRALVPRGATLAQLALKWILMFPAVSVVIPGAKTPEQAEENVRAAALPDLGADTMARVRDVYDRYFRASIHSRW